MANLPPQVLNDMATYALTPVSPLDNIVPGTNNEHFREFACWNWALAGGIDGFPAISTPDAICQAIFITQDGLPIGLNKPFEGIIDCDAQLARIEANFAKALYELDDEAQTIIMTQIVEICARMNNLVLGGEEADRYRLHMNTGTLADGTTIWWSWQHWAISVRLEDQRAFVQTVPGFALYQAGAHMWDYPNPEVSVALDGLCNQQVAVMEAIVPNE